MNADEVAELLSDARGGGRESLGKLLQFYRNYLTVLAASQLNRRLCRRVGPSDLVQEAMLAAHHDFAKFRGASEPEFVAWLRQILINCLHHTIEMHLKARKRDIRCEVSIDQMRTSMDQSAIKLADVVPDPGLSPSTIIYKQERAMAVADHLAQLKADYRDVIVLRNLRGLTFDEIAERMDRKPGTVRMLWLRAIEKFKQLYEHVE